MISGLIHLATLNSQSPETLGTTTNVGSVYANDLITLNLDRNIPRGGTDMVLPEYLMVDMSVQPIENTIEHIIKNYRLIFNMGGNDMIIPLQILNYLEKPTMTPRNKLKIPINFNYFFNNDDGLPMVSLQFTQVHVRIENIMDGRTLNNVKLICKGKYLDGGERRRFLANPYDYKSRKLTTLQLESTTSQKAFNIYGGGILGGIVLQINNIDTTIENIQGIEFTINGNTRHNFDTDLIDTHCQRLSETAIYIPMNLDSNLRSEINSSALNLSRIDDFQIRITTNLNMGFSITAYTIQPNLYRVASGMIGEVFNFNLSLDIPTPINRDGAVARIPFDQPLHQPPWTVCKIDFPILPDVNCSISYEPIDVSNGICKCNQCNNIFGYEAFKIWITQRTRSCPLCRNTNIEEKYYTITGEPISFRRGDVIQLPENLLF
jgi:hypothetical protein